MRDHPIINLQREHGDGNGQKVRDQREPAATSVNLTAEIAELAPEPMRGGLAADVPGSSCSSEGRARRIVPSNTGANSSTVASDCWSGGRDHRSTGGLRSGPEPARSGQRSSAPVRASVGISAGTLSTRALMPMRVRRATSYRPGTSRAAVRQFDLFAQIGNRHFSATQAQINRGEPRPCRDLFGMAAAFGATGTPAAATRPAVAHLMRHDRR